jgi:hypothetical protein
MPSDQNDDSVKSPNGAPDPHPEPSGGGAGPDDLPGGLKRGRKCAAHPNTLTPSEEFRYKLIWFLEERKIPEKDFAKAASLSPRGLDQILEGKRSATPTERQRVEGALRFPVLCGPHAAVTVRVGDRTIEADAGIAPLLEALGREGLAPDIHCEQNPLGRPCLFYADIRKAEGFLQAAGWGLDIRAPRRRRMAGEAGGDVPPWVFKAVPLHASGPGAAPGEIKFGLEILPAPEDMDAVLASVRAYARRPAPPPARP